MIRMLQDMAAQGHVQLTCYHGTLWRCMPYSSEFEPLLAQPAQAVTAEDAVSVAYLQWSHLRRMKGAAA